MLLLLIHLLALSNPFGALPVFISQTSAFSSQKRRLAGLLTGVSVAVITLFFAAFGQNVLAGLGVKLNDFRLAGGLVLTLMGIHMLQGENSSLHHDSSAETSTSSDLASVIVTPLSIPLIAGPGVLCTVVSADKFDLLSKLGACLGLGFTVAVLFYFSEHIVKLLSKSVLRVVARLMGLVIVTIAMDMVVLGLGTAFPTWLSAT
mgnify:CR=1 FL=1